MKNLIQIFLSSNATISEALKAIDQGAVQIALVVVEGDRLLGTLSDGDIRRGLLNNMTLDQSIRGLYKRKPITANKAYTKKDLHQLCFKHNISQVPIVDRDNRIIDLFVLNDSTFTIQRKNKVVLMVGGLGTRLRPLTDKTPKPMLEVGGKPILHKIIEGFVKHGFTEIIMCVGYKSNIIQDYFKNGEELGVTIEYIIEEKRMGTAGALSLIKNKFDLPFFVMNGDLLTKVNYSKMLDFHNFHDSNATMCVREYDLKVPFGVVSIENEFIKSIEEKPIHNFFVNAGVYILKPECIDLIPKNQFFDITSLFDKLISKNAKITSFYLNEFWLDVGQKEDYEIANKIFRDLPSV